VRAQKWPIKFSLIINFAEKEFIEVIKSEKEEDENDQNTLRNVFLG